MSYSRRSLMSALAAAAGTVVAESFLYSQTHSTPQPRPSPNTPDPNHPWGLGGSDGKPHDTKVVARQNQADVRAGVQKLYELISELKEQVEKSDAALVLSVSVVKKSQEIEKLAKHVKELAKG